LGEIEPRKARDIAIAAIPGTFRFLRAA